jgi:hypothetical protein
MPPRYLRLAVTVRGHPPFAGIYVPPRVPLLPLSQMTEKLKIFTSSKGLNQQGVNLPAPKPHEYRSQEATGRDRTWSEV